MEEIAESIKHITVKGGSSDDIYRLQYFFRLFDSYHKTIREKEVKENTEINNDEFYIEITDIFIRLLAFMGDKVYNKNISFNKLLQDKLKVNEKRPHKNGREW